MPDQAAGRPALGTLIGAGTIPLLFLVAILLWIRSKIGYNVGGYSGSGGLLSRRWLLAGRPFSFAMKALSYPIIWTRKAALFGAACCILSCSSSIYFGPKAVNTAI
jgi:hypothetical protein